jgi:hypothetical protein
MSYGYVPKAVSQALFWDKTDNFHFKSIGCSNEKWAKCIEVNEAYIKKDIVKTIF